MRRVSRFRLMRCALLRAGSIAAVWIVVASPQAGEPTRPVQDQIEDVTPTSVVQAELAPGQSRAFRLNLQKGESALVQVMQMGVDVVLDLKRPDGKLVDEFDTPNGRNGPELCDIFAPEPGGYTIVVRPISKREPTGRFEFRVLQFRDATQTLGLTRKKQAAQALAAQWLRRHSAPITPGFKLTGPEGKLLDKLAARARVLGLGEATHGSAEFGEMKLAITKHLVSKCGYRLVSLEFSAARANDLEPYVAGAPVAKSSLLADLNSGWIERRARNELIDWLREWNLAHPKDRVTLIGVDAQDNGPAAARLDKFLQRAYGPGALQPWLAAKKELAEANEQTWVFGNSSVSLTNRNAMMDLLARLELDRAWLNATYGPKETDDAIESARILAEFADFNSRAPTGRNRDWYMAIRVLRALSGIGAGAHAVYWAHNSHVATTDGFKVTGRLLRDALGSQYRALAMTCGAGSFVAEIPSDPEDRLAASRFSDASRERIEEVLERVGRGPFIASWNKDVDDAPSLLNTPARMHWVGGLFAPNTPPSGQSRPFNLVHDFDGVVYLPTVRATEIPRDRPSVPPRPRAQAN